MDKKKKEAGTGGNRCPNVGEMIRVFIDTHGVSKNESARRLCTERQTVYRTLKNQSVPTELLWRISKVLEHNFFADISDLM